MSSRLAPGATGDVTAVVPHTWNCAWPKALVCGPCALSHRAGSPVSGCAVPRHGYIETHRAERDNFQRVFFRERLGGRRSRWVNLQAGHPLPSLHGELVGAAGGNWVRRPGIRSAAPHGGDVPAVVTGREFGLSVSEAE